LQIRLYLAMPLLSSKSKELSFQPRNCFMAPVNPHNSKGDKAPHTKIIKQKGKYSKVLN